MMKILSHSGLFVLFVLTLASCDKKITGVGDPVTEKRSMPVFTAINLAMAERIYLVQDSTYSIVLEGQQNILDEVVTLYDNGGLTFRIKDHHSLGNHTPVRVTIHAPGVTAVSVSGSGSLNVMSAWTGAELSAGLGGSGEINLNKVETAVIRVNISGSGSLKAVSGFAGQQHLTISGSGNMNLQNVKGDTVYSSISGSGDMSVWTAYLLDGTISGSGNIYYRGTPVIISHISGSGRMITLYLAGFTEFYPGQNNG